MEPKSQAIWLLKEADSCYQNEKKKETDRETQISLDLKKCR